MASIQIHEDRENRGRDLKSRQNAPVLGPQKRTVLGAIDNNVASRNLKAKQPLGKSKLKVNDENTYNKQVGCKQPAPVVPVAQFQAFKVYEDGQEEKISRTGSKRTEDIFRNVQNSIEKERLDNSKETLENDGVFDLPKQQVIEINVKPSPMSVEKTNENARVDEVLSVCNRNKDFFFELEEYKDDIYKHLLIQEKVRRAKSNYMRKQPDITQNMRTILIDWLVEVAEEYKLQTETLYLAVNYIDRFLSFMSVVRAKLQLVGTAAMFIAAKYEEIYPPDVGEFVYITDDTYTKRQVIRMEMLILKVLDFDLSLPTAYTFITAISICNKLSDKVTFLAQFLSELALLEAEPTLEILPSVMAGAAIAVARHTLDEEAWSDELEMSTSYSLESLQKAIVFLSTLHRKAASMQQQAIQEKYKSGKYLHVSTLEPRNDDINFD